MRISLKANWLVESQTSLEGPTVMPWTICVMFPITLNFEEYFQVIIGCSICNGCSPCNRAFSQGWKIVQAVRAWISVTLGLRACSALGTTAASPLGGGGGWCLVTASALVVGGESGAAAGAASHHTSTPTSAPPLGPGRGDGEGGGGDAGAPTLDLPNSR